MRDRLIELIKPYVSGCACEDESGSCELTTCRDCNAQVLADYLLENGVVVLPELKHKQTVYHIYNNKIMPLEVTSYAIRPEFDNLLQIHLYRSGFNGCCTMEDFGKTAFLTREEADAALRKEDEGK